MHEGLEIIPWFESVLKPVTGCDVYLDLIPRGIPLPAIRASIRDSLDVRGGSAPTQRVLTRIDWLIVLIKEGLHIADVLTQVNAMDTALQNTNGTTGTVRIYSCVRLEPFTLIEPEDSGVQYRHLGGIYRTMVGPL